MASKAVLQNAKSGLFSVFNQVSVNALIPLQAHILDTLHHLFLQYTFIEFKKKGSNILPESHPKLIYSNILNKIHF